MRSTRLVTAKLTAKTEEALIMGEGRVFINASKANLPRRHHASGVTGFARRNSAEAELNIVSI